MTTPLTWITDRLPTEADADDDGDVLVLSNSGKTWYATDWEVVRPGQSWLPFIPPTGSRPSVPTSQPRRIVSITESEGTVMAVADDGSAWRLSATWSQWIQLPALPDREVDRAAGVVS